MRCCLRPGVAFHRLPGRLPLPVRCSATVNPPPRRVNSEHTSVSFTALVRMELLSWLQVSESHGMRCEGDIPHEMKSVTGTGTGPQQPKIFTPAWQPVTGIMWLEIQRSLLYLQEARLRLPSLPHIFTRTSWNYSTCSTVGLPECKAGVLWPDCKLQLNYRGGI